MNLLDLQQRTQRQIRHYILHLGPRNHVIHFNTVPNIAAGKNESGTTALAEDTLDHLLKFLKESSGSPGWTD